MSRANAASMVRPYGALENEFWAIGQKITVFILLLLVMVSAIGVVYSVHLSRKTVAALSVLDKQQHAIDVEWGRLLIEQSAWGGYGRVEKIAAERLGMKMPEPNRIVMLKKQ